MLMRGPLRNSRRTWASFPQQNTGCCLRRRKSRANGRSEPMLRWKPIPPRMDATTPCNSQSQAIGRVAANCFHAECVVKHDSIFDEQDTIAINGGAQ